MFKGTIRYLVSACTAAVLALTLTACGGDTPAPVKEKETPKTVEPAKEKDGAKEVSYKCAKCAKTKTAAVGAKAPS